MEVITNMKRDQLTSISPLDGRYSDKTGELIDIFSEYGLIRFRVEIEVRWLQTLSKHNDIKELANFDETTNKQLNEKCLQINTVVDGFTKNINNKESKIDLIDKEINKDIYNSIYNIVKCDKFKFVWYENPKMSIDDIYHIQVFWTRTKKFDLKIYDHQTLI